MILIKLLASLSVVWILKDSYIFSYPRKIITSLSIHLEKLFGCSLCLGFWVGLLVGCINYYFDKNIQFLIYYPFASSGFCWFFDSLIDLIQYQCATIKKKFEDES